MPPLNPLSPPLPLPALLLLSMPSKPRGGSLFTWRADPLSLSLLSRSLLSLLML